jgi:hypothetical protein
MLFQGTMITNASGRLGDTIWSRNRGGPYARAYVVPTDPNTSEQQAARNSMAHVVNRWQTTLSPAQRTAWSEYSRGIHRPNRIGERRSVGGFPEYVKANFLRRYELTWLGVLGLPDVDDPPPKGHGATPLSMPTVASVSTLDGTVEVTFNADDPWWSQQAGLYIWGAAASTVTINWFRGPWTLLYAGGFHASNPATFGLGYVPASTNRLFFKARVSDEWGQPSTRAYFRYDVP